MDLAVLCDSEVQSPFATAIHLLVGLFIIASYIPQFIRITTTSAGTTGISGWYIILLTTSATSHFAARIKNLNTSFAWGCFRRGDLQGFNAFSALVIYLQAFIHWAAAITLLAFYVYFRNDAHSSPSSSPSNPVILGIVLTHAAIVIPPAIYLLQLIIHEDHPDFDVILGLNSIYGIFLRFLGILTSVTAAIPQIHLMVTQSNSQSTFRDRNLDPRGGLSLLSLGLQVITFTALAGSQGWRTRPPPPPPGSPPSYEPVSIWSVEWWAIFFFWGGLAAGWVVLAGSQLLVLCVALGLGLGDGVGAGRGRIHLRME